MGDSRQYILNSIRNGLQSALLPEATPDRFVNTLPSMAGDLDHFAAEIERLSGRVLRAGSSREAARAVAQVCQDRGWRQVLAWAWDAIGCEGLPEALAQAGVTAVHSGTPRDLAMIPAGLTGAEAALSDTGTVVVRNGPGRSPLASLLPPVHIVLLDATRLRPDMHHYWLSLGNAPGSVQSSSNLVFISGPSRTADIEQTLTLGVHGPHELIVVVWGNEP